MASAQILPNPAASSRRDLLQAGKKKGFNSCSISTIIDVILSHHSALGPESVFERWTVLCDPASPSAASNSLFHKTYKKSGGSPPPPIAAALRWRPEARRLSRLITTLPADHRAALNLSNYKFKELSSLGHVEDARNVFDKMPLRSDFTWHNMLMAYSQNGMIEEVHSLLDAFPYRKVRSYTIVIPGYTKLGRVAEAHRLFDTMPERNPVAWNALISDYVQNGDLKTVRALFDKMPKRNTAS